MRPKEERIANTKYITPAFTLPVDAPLILRTGL